MNVCIIGAGLMGLTTAYYLKRAGADVCVVDRQTGPGLETSFANGGMLHASQANPWNEPGILSAALKMLGKEDAALLIRAKALPQMLGWGWSFLRESRPENYQENLAKNAALARYSISELGKLRGNISLNYDQQELGTLKIFRSESDRSHALSYLSRYDDFDIPYEVCDVERLILLEPALAPIAQELKGAIYFPTDETGDAQKFCEQLHDICAENGVEFRFSTDVVDLLSEKNRVERVVTSTGESIETKAVVLALGSYTSQLSKRVKLRLPIQPVKGYSITVPVGRWSSPPMIPVIDEQMHAAVCPLGSRLRVAGTAEFAGYDSRLTVSRINNLIELLKLTYPEFSPFFSESSIKPWTGLRPMTPDGVGIIGSTPISNLYVNTGHGHLGWTMAVGSGKLLADHMTGQQCDISMDKFTLSRFS